MSAECSPAISVIVPCYKVTAFIGEALDSLRKQTFHNFEVIVVNDGCPDTLNLERALEPYRDEIVYVKQDNLGLSGARNTGIAVARAPILAFLDGDDLFEPEYLQYQFEVLQANPEIDLVYSNAVLFEPGIDESSVGSKFAVTFRSPTGASFPDGPARPLYMDIFPNEGEVTFESLIKRRCHVFGCLVARREIILRAGGYDVGLRACEDLDLWIRVAKIGGRFAYHSKPLYRYRIHSGGMTSQSLFLQSNLVAMLEKQRRTLDPSCQEREWVEEELRKERGMLDFLLGRRELYAGNRERALEHLICASRVVKGRKLSLTIAALRLVPWLLVRYVRHHYPTEQAFVS